jgi:hypothetical protein
MSITLDALTLPADLIWTDEFDWTPMEQNKYYTLTGALVIESGQMLAGRPITLVGGDNAAWADRTLVSALYDKLVGDATMLLTLHDARAFNVKFLMNAPIQARLVLDYNNPIADDWYSLTLKFMQI